MRYITKSLSKVNFFVKTNLQLGIRWQLKKSDMFFKLTIRRKNYRKTIQQHNLKWISKNYKTICKKILKNIQCGIWPYFNITVKFWIEIWVAKIQFNIALDVKKFSINKIVSNNANLNKLYIFKTFFTTYIISIIIERKIVETTKNQCKKFRLYNNRLNYNIIDILTKINYRFYKHYNNKITVRKYISNLNSFFNLNSIETSMNMFLYMIKK